MIIEIKKLLVKTLLYTLVMEDKLVGPQAAWLRGFPLCRIIADLYSVLIYRVCFKNIDIINQKRGYLVFY